MDISITEKQIEEFVQNALIKSAIGTRIQGAVQEALGKGYDNPIDKAVKAYVLIVAEELIRSQFSEQIKAAVSEVIEKQVTSELIATVVSASANKMVRAAEDSRY